MKREEIRELKAFPIQLGAMPTPDDAWFSIDPGLNARRDLDDEEPVDEPEEGTLPDEAPAGALALGDSGPLPEARGRAGDGRANIVL